MTSVTPKEIQDVESHLNEQVEISPLLVLPDDYEIQILSDICSAGNDSSRSKGQVGEDKEPNGFKTWPFFFFFKWKNRPLARLQVSHE